ncbi:MAG: hypothetical protein BMS9Abin31_1268 [Gammaproteobacteria bacterium]|nr:MAG: hypothetical protein BMS9Abin31_1268 [Gammaproteobacteria bacterium]
MMLGFGRVSLIVRLLLTYDWRSNTQIVNLITNKKDPLSKPNNYKDVNRHNHHTLSQNQSKYGYIKTHKIVDTHKQTATLTLQTKLSKNKNKLFGSMSIPLNTSNLYTFPITEDKKENNYLITTLIFTQLDERDPHTFKIKLPIEDVSSIVDKIMEISFELEIVQLFDDIANVKAQTSQVYLITGSQIAGPQALIVE